jgi:plastocyanin
VKTRGIILAVFLALAVRGENIEGTAVIKKQLTKRRVTAAVPLYQRGQGVGLAADTEDDPLAAERSHVVIWLVGFVPPNAGIPVVATSAVVKMEQKNRSFVPDTVVISTGGKVSFPNLDPIFHNVFSLSKPKAFDLGNYPKGETRTVTFPEPGIVYVNCRLHPNMTGVIVVAPNQWNTRADRSGRFVLNDVPPGQYTVVAWHKAAGFFRQQVQVKAGHDLKIEFLIPIGFDGSRLQTKR